MSARSTERVAEPQGPADAASQDELFVIHNPAAGPRRPDRLRRRIEATLSARRVSYEYAFTRGPRHAEELARTAVARGYRRVVVAGGDGTVLEAVSALIDSDAALALVPVGTGNQLAANLGVPRKLGKSIELAVGGGIRRIDVGMIDGRPFTCIAGAGFDAEVVRPGSEIKRRLGYLAYVRAAAVAAFAPKPSRLHLTVDGQQSSFTGIGVEITNMPSLTAPGLLQPVPIVPDGRADDGLLDVCVLASRTTRDFLSVLGSILTRRYERNPRLHYFRGREIVVDADPALPTQADGERLGMTPFTVNVRPRALSVVVPSA